MRALTRDEITFQLDCEPDELDERVNEEVLEVTVTAGWTCPNSGVTYTAAASVAGYSIGDRHEVRSGETVARLARQCADMYRLELEAQNNLNERIREVLEEARKLREALEDTPAREKHRRATRKLRRQGLRENRLTIKARE